MKKLIALALVLMMALAAIPALAEDYSGTWYLNVAGISMAQVDLNADGSMAIITELEGETETQEGTWTSNEVGIELEVNGEKIGFISLF